MKVGDYVKFNDKYEKTQIGKIVGINYQEKCFEVIYESDKGWTRNTFLDFDDDYIVYSEENKEKDPSQIAKADEGKAYPIRFEVKAVDDAHCLYDFVYSDSHGCTITKQIALDDIINELFARMGAAPSQTAKADEGKLQLTLVPTQIIKDIAEVRMYGNKKYHDPDNWKTVEESRYRDAAFRHFLAYLDDPDGVDEESGIAHLKHLACNIAFLCEFYEKRNRKG